MTRRSLVAAGIGTIIALSVAAGCGGDDGARRAVTPAGPYTLVFTGHADDASFPHLYAASGEDWSVERLPVALDDNDELVWSPTFRHLARRGGVVLRIDRGTWRQVLDNAAFSEGFPWAPDGRRLVYSDDPYEEGPIVVVSADGSRPREIARGALPTWAADGRVYFWRGALVHAIDPGSGSTEEVATDDALWILQFGAWAPAGDRIAYAVGKEDARSLNILDLDTHESRPLLTDVDPPITDVRAYAWAPDGERLAVIAGRDDPSAEPLGPGTYGIRWELHIVDVSDGDSHKLLNAEAHGLAWSPDGEWLSLTRHWGYDAARDAASDVWVVRPDGTELRRVTNGRDPGKHWDETTGTDYGDVAWVPESVVAELRRRR